MFFIAYTFKGQVHEFAGRVKIVSHLSCRTNAIFKYFCPLTSVLSVMFVNVYLKICHFSEKDENLPIFSGCAYGVYSGSL